MGWYSRNNQASPKTTKPSKVLDARTIKGCRLRPQRQKGRKHHHLRRLDAAWDTKLGMCCDGVS